MLMASYDTASVCFPSYTECGMYPFPADVVRPAIVVITQLVIVHVLKE
jgi:hypothetical protein